MFCGLTRFYIKRQFVYDGMWSLDAY